MSVTTPDTATHDNQGSQGNVVEPLDAASTSLQALEPDLIESPPFSGHLAIKPSQKQLEPEQEAAFSAIVNFPVSHKNAWAQANWELIIAHINVFLHVCQARGLDPWAKQIYLVKRGTDNNPTFTIQTGIDGYRFLAERTRRAVGTAKIVWSGANEDEKSWREVVDPDLGITVMEPRWWRAWPKEFGHPGMARAVLPYYTTGGELIRADVVAHWGMFAPYHQEYEGARGNRRKKYDANGQPVMKLAEMWARDGGSHMLGKCAEAAAIRKAFSEAVAGIFVHEEMHQADAKAKEEREQERYQRIVEARQEEARQEQARRESVTLQGAVLPDDTGGAEPGTGVDGALQAEGPSPQQRRAWLLEELEEMTRIRGGDHGEAVKFFEARLGCPLPEADPDDLLAMVGPLRQYAIAALRKASQEAETKARAAEQAGDTDARSKHLGTAARLQLEADAYEQFGTKAVAPVDELLGRVIPAADDDESDESDENGRESGEETQEPPPVPDPEPEPEPEPAPEPEDAPGAGEDEQDTAASGR